MDKDIVNIIGCIILFIALGLFAICTFILAEHKEEIWDKIKNEDHN